MILEGGHEAARVQTPGERPLIVFFGSAYLANASGVCWCSSRWIERTRLTGHDRWTQNSIVSCLSLTLFAATNFIREGSIMRLNDIERDCLTRLSFEPWTSPPVFDHGLLERLVREKYVMTRATGQGVHYEITDCGRAAILKAGET